MICVCTVSGWTCEFGVFVNKKKFAFVFYSDLFMCMACFQCMKFPLQYNTVFSVQREYFILVLNAILTNKCVYFVIKCKIDGVLFNAPRYTHMASCVYIMFNVQCCWDMTSFIHGQTYYLYIILNVR